MRWDVWQGVWGHGLGLRGVRGVAGHGLLRGHGVGVSGVRGVLRGLELLGAGLELLEGLLGGGHGLGGGHLGWERLGLEGLGLDWLRLLGGLLLLLLVVVVVGVGVASAVLALLLARLRVWRRLRRCFGGLRLVLRLRTGGFGGLCHLRGLEGCGGGASLFFL